MQEELLTDEQIQLEKIIFDIRTFSLSERGFSKTKIEELIEKKYITRKDGKILLTPT